MMLRRTRVSQVIDAVSKVMRSENDGCETERDLPQRHGWILAPSIRPPQAAIRSVLLGCDVFLWIERLEVVKWFILRRQDPALPSLIRRDGAVDEREVLFDRAENLLPCLKFEQADSDKSLEKSRKTAQRLVPVARLRDLQDSIDRRTPIRVVNKPLK